MVKPFHSYRVWLADGTAVELKARSVLEAREIVNDGRRKAPYRQPRIARVEKVPG